MASRAQRMVRPVDDGLVLHGKLDTRGVDVRRVCRTGPVVAVEIDVQLAAGRSAALPFGQKATQPAGEIHAAALDAHQRDGFVIGNLFQNLAGQAVETALHSGRGHDFLRVHGFLHGYVARHVH
jgi:hypothetical protein